MLELNHKAVLAYQRTFNRGRRKWIWSTMTRHSRCLFDLAEVESGSTVSNRYNAGVQTVPIDQIRGSSGRVADFDCDFNPLQSHTKDRWLRIAEARQKGQALPVVNLTQIGNVYFVRDGHHRISVAQALGQREIEAKVTVWELFR